MVTNIIERLQARLEKTGISDEISRVYMLRIEHIYYKVGSISSSVLRVPWDTPSVVRVLTFAKIPRQESLI